MFRLFALLYAPFLLPHLLLLRVSPNREHILQDLERWGKRHGITGSPGRRLLHFLTFSRDFRNIFYYRTRGIAWSRLLRIYCPREKYFIIDPRTKIAGGLISAHPYATILNAESIGANFYVNQLVTIGEVDGKRPVIGDNVSVYSGAIIIGGITIGNHVQVGAGAVVVKDVPPNSTVVGNPARIIPKGVKS
ncbi:serine acetyltransferase [Robiginitalea sp. M366]|uniref:serine acetyltransferase n=1 Tax=Robiginitalea aestuariiviva TaxID=3036903 RepID=UPI00240E3098|nr:serine acetyltransferase [Robiginitalea aestuariiviva]MDG1572734.1 serine acetyltransferase [Robiginitalea aestuariiviva]